NLNITLGWQACKAFYASVSGKFVGSRYDVGGYKKPDVSLDSYFLLSAYTEFAANKGLKFFADAQNITNQKFFDIRGYNSIPFMFSIGATIKL
ncbi:hypothetical protein ABTL66_19145, partial [Acinetobacter baumannii]